MTSMLNVLTSEISLLTSEVSLLTSEVEVLTLKVKVLTSNMTKTPVFGRVITVLMDAFTIVLHTITHRKGLIADMPFSFKLHFKRIVKRLKFFGGFKNFP